MKNKNDCKKIKNGRCPHGWRPFTYNLTITKKLPKPSNERNNVIYNSMPEPGIVSRIGRDWV